MVPEKTNLLVLTVWSLDDPLIQTYTLPYVRIVRRHLPSTSKIFLVTLEKDRTVDKSKTGERRAVLEQEGIHWITFPYRPWGPAALLLWGTMFLRLSWLIITCKVSVIHSWCTPAGGLGFMLASILRRKHVIDSFEPHAEAMIENGTWHARSWAFRILFWLEKKQTQHAAWVIATTQGMKDYAKTKYQVTIPNFLVKPACVDLTRFDGVKGKDTELAASLGLMNKTVCVYAGKLGGIYLKEEVFQFIKAAIGQWGDQFRFLFLTSHTQEEIAALCANYGIDIHVIVSRFVPHAEIHRYMMLADFAITPVKPVPTKRYCTPIKDGEYWALGLPVIISPGISDDSGIIAENDIGAVLPAWDDSSFRWAFGEIVRLKKDPALPMRIRQVAVRYRSFDIAEAVYRTVYRNS